MRGIVAGHVDGPLESIALPFNVEALLKLLHEALDDPDEQATVTAPATPTKKKIALVFMWPSSSRRRRGARILAPLHPSRTPRPLNFPTSMSQSYLLWPRL
jgi:hypothetical protein